MTKTAGRHISHCWLLFKVLFREALNDHMSILPVGLAILPFVDMHNMLLLDIISKQFPEKQDRRLLTEDIKVSQCP